MICFFSFNTTNMFVTLTFVAMNVGFNDRFIIAFLRSWSVAFVLVTLSILYLTPGIKKD